MAHFAHLNEKNEVIHVIVVNNEVITDENGEEQEQLGIDFLKGLQKIPENNLGEGEWIQCSYNGKLRKNYPSKGDIYDSVRDAFIGHQPFPSWTLDEDTCIWEPPTADPTDGKVYEWNEATTSWDEPPQMEEETE